MSYTTIDRNLRIALVVTFPVNFFVFVRNRLNMTSLRRFFVADLSYPGVSNFNIVCECDIDVKN